MKQCQGIIRRGRDREHNDKWAFEPHQCKNTARWRVIWNEQEISHLCTACLNRLRAELAPAKIKSERLPE